MIQLTEIEIPATELDGILRKHNLLTGSLRTHPQLVVAISAAARFQLLHEEQEVLATMIELPLQEPGVLDVTIIPEVRRLHQQKDGLADLGEALRKSWFSDHAFEKVQSLVPASRIHTKKIFKAMGFREESHERGIRKAFNFGKGWENGHLLVLCPEDPARKPYMAKLAAEVTNGVE